MSPSTAPLISRYTYRLHSRALILEGVLGGVLVTSDVVARKSLGATPWQIVLLTMAPAALQVLALFVAHRIESFGRRRFFFAAGVAGRLCLVGAAFVTGAWPFLVILVVHGLVQAVVVPAQNAVYQSNYAPEVRGRLFGRASMFGGLAIALAALGAGMVLDHDDEAYRWVYPVAGVAGFAACWVFGSIRLRRARDVAPTREEGEAEEEAPGPTPLGVLRETLVRDAAFRRFEGAMFVYGLGFMCMQPVFALLFVDELRMSYRDAALAKGVVFYAVHVAFLGVAGRLLDRIGLERLATLACVILAVFAGAMAAVTTPAWAIAAFSLYGLGMAGLNIVWSMGPIQYAPPGGAARYMGVHVALVGLRAVIGQPLGGALADGFGSPRPAFVAAAVLFLSATLLMRRARRMAGVG